MYIVNALPMILLKDCIENQEGRHWRIKASVTKRTVLLLFIWPQQTKVNVLKQNTNCVSNNNT